jgi:hypothetical protein
MLKLKTLLVIAAIYLVSCNSSQNDNGIFNYDMGEFPLSEDPGALESCECGEISYFGVMREGLLVVVREGCDYYVNEFAELAIQDTFCDAEYFWGDYSVVVSRADSANFSIIDRSGNNILDVEQDYDDMSMGWGSNYVIFEKNGLEGVMDLKGNIIIDLQPFDVHISGDLAILDEEMRCTHIYDLKTGDLVAEYNFGYDSVNDGFIRVSNIHEGYYLDSLGEIIYGPFDSVAEFSEGLAKVSMNGMFGFINVEGEIEIPLQYEMDGFAGLYYSFHDGLCGMMNEDAQGDDKYGYINREGEMVIPQIYDYTFHFENGMANVEIGEDSFFINTKGEIVVSGHDYYNVAAPGLYYAREKDHVMFYNDAGEKYKLICQDIAEFYNGRTVYEFHGQVKSISIEEIIGKLKG